VWGTALETPKTTVVANDHESSLEGLEGLPSAEDVRAKRSAWFFMVKMVRATRRTFSLRRGRLVVRPKLPFVIGFLATAIAVLAALSWFHRNQVDEAHSAELTLNQIAVLTREINNLTFASLQKHNLTPEADTEMRAARRALPEAVVTAHIHAYHTAALEKVWPTLDNYITSAGRQWIMMRVGDFDEAQQADFQAVSPQFDLMQHQVQMAVEAEDRWAQTVALRARNESLAAAILAATTFLILFLRLQRQEHLGQLQETERNALRDSEERFRALTEQSTDIILIADPSGQIKYASPSVHTVLMAHGESLVGTNMIDLVHPDDFAKIMSTGPRPVAYRQNPVVELRLRHTDGRWLDFECVVRNLIQHKNIDGIVYNARDITERKHAQEQLLFNATHDALTGLPDRALFLGRLQSVVDRMKRHPHEAAAVLFIDIDDFKVVNDCYGHAIGDALIKEVSNRLRACLRSDGTIARMGGDEFTVLVEDVTDPSDAIRVAERIQSSFERPFRLEGLEVFKSTSIGIALTSPETSADAVLQNADIAMYRAKSQGKACSELFDRTMHEQVMSRLSIEAKLRHALENEELTLHYQPIVAVNTRAVQGFEALLRWQPSGSNSIPPSTFVPVAEQCGLIVPISVWVLKKACLEAVSWRQRYPDDPPLYVSINISSKHFSHAGFIGHVKDALEESAVDPQYVTIELTESLAMNDVAATEQTMSQLRTLGVKLSIDDFGTGYSSLSYLRRFPVDTLKIDQSFVKTMDAENYAIVKTIIGLARNLELKVVAEGVETPNQHQLLALAGCASAQGYLFAEPMPAKNVGVFVESNRRDSGRTKQKGLARSTAPDDLASTHHPDVLAR
jgi:diguanylate cyclase (GGDEF)-like protein/PAS domain S-box-containing protein